MIKKIILADFKNSNKDKVDQALKNIKDKIDKEKSRIKAEKEEVSKLKKNIDGQKKNIDTLPLSLNIIKFEISDLLELSELKSNEYLEKVQKAVEDLFKEIENINTIVDKMYKFDIIDGLKIEDSKKLEEISSELQTASEKIFEKFREIGTQYKQCVKEIGGQLLEKLKEKKKNAKILVNKLTNDLKIQEAVVLRVGNELKSFGDSPVDQKSNEKLGLIDKNIAREKGKVSECDTTLNSIEVSQIAPTSKEGICEVSGKLKKLAKAETVLDGVKKTIDANKVYLATKVEANKALCFKTIATIAEIILNQTDKRIKKYNGLFGFNFGKTKRKVKSATEFNEVITNLRAAALSQKEEDILPAGGVIKKKVNDYKGVASQLIGSGLLNRNRFTDNDQGYFAIMESNLEILDKQIETLSNLKLSA